MHPDAIWANERPATFQCLMESCLGEMHLNWCIIYLDDVIIFSKTPDKHIERLRGILQKLQNAGLKLKPSKCEFFKDRISYLGHIVSKNGVETDPKKISGNPRLVKATNSLPCEKLSGIYKLLQKIYV